MVRASQSGGNGTGNAGFAYPRGAYEAEDGALKVSSELTHCKVLQHSSLHLHIISCGLYFAKVTSL